MSTISDAKRLIALSQEGLRLLGMGVSKPCSQARYNIAAQAALSDPQAGYTDTERRAIAEFVDGEIGEPDTRSYAVRLRLTQGERARLERAATRAGMDMSEFLRSVIPSE